MPDDKKKAVPAVNAPGATFPGGTGAALPDADTPAGRLALAVAGKPARALAEVAAADVVAVADLVPEDKRSKTVAALRAGAAQALAERPAAEDLRVFQYAAQLGQLLEAAGEPVRQAP